MTDHRAVAAALISVVANEGSESRGMTDQGAMSVVAQAAIANALLAVEARIGELVAQQRLANYVDAMTFDIRPSQFDSWEKTAMAGEPFGRKGRQ